jgi:hypothetical protein
MSDRDAGEKKLGRVLRCDEWEALIADALDGTLAADDSAAFARHHSECALCGQMLRETRQGLAWMEHLRAEPDLPAGLLKTILARTSERQNEGIGHGAAALPSAVPPGPAWYRTALPVVRHIFEPRLMMTAAMAFFSIALTLNLTGVRLSELRASDLRPSQMRASFTRRYYSTNEQVMKYYENLRLVYEMEARVRELRRSTETEPPAEPSHRETKQPVRDGTGTPSSKVPQEERISPAPRRAPLKGDAALPAMMVHSGQIYLPQVNPERPTEVPTGFDYAGEREQGQKEVFRALLTTTEDQAGRSLV